MVGLGWPAVDVRQEMLAESVQAMRALWSGETTTFRGKHVTVEDARLYTLPDQPPEVLIAGSGPSSFELAADLGDGMVAVEPQAAFVEQFRKLGGEGKRTLGQAALSYDADEASAREYAMRFAFGVVAGWKVMAELPNVVSFDAAVETVREDDVVGAPVVGPLVPAGDDAAAHAKAVTDFVDAGFEEVAVVQVGDDHDGFFRFWSEEVRPQLP